MNISIPQSTLTALNKLTNNGFDAYIVGGCVRDSLMGLPPKDWDICTSALPGQIMDCFQGLRIIETGLKHGTVTVMVPGAAGTSAPAVPIEITTYRIDGAYSDYRRPDQVSFTSSVTDDLARRDFTMNAMAYHPDTGLQDPFGGASDIARGRIRCVGDPDKRFREDALRMMRALRFAAVTGFAIEERTFVAARKNSHLLQKIAAERIMSELCKLLCGAHCYRALDDGREIIAVFIPEITAMFGFDQHNPHHVYDVWQHTLHAVENIDEDICLRLAMLFHDIGKPHTFSRDKKGIGHFYGHTKKSAEMAAIILKRLRTDNQTLQIVEELVHHHSIDIPPAEKAVKKWLGRLGEEQLRRLVKVKRADTLAKGLREETQRRLAGLERLSSLIDDVIASGSCFTLKDLAVNGNDLKSIGITDGKTIGKILGMLLARVIDEKMQNEKNELLRGAAHLVGK